VIRSNYRLTIREVYEEVGISKAMCHQIPTENSGIHLAAAKSVPHPLTEDQKPVLMSTKNVSTMQMLMKTI